MKKVKFLMLSLSILAATSVFAQKESKKDGNAFSIGVDGGLPIGDFNKSNNFGIGGSAKAVFSIFEGGAVTLSAGYITFSGKGSTTLTGYDTAGMPTYGKGASFNTIPIKAGIRFNIAEGFYGEPQLGVTIANTKVISIDQNFNITNNSQSKSYFTYAAGVGYVVNNMVDIGVRYEGFSQKVPSYSLDQNGNLTTSTSNKTTGFIGVRIAYNFSL